MQRSNGHEQLIFMDLETTGLDPRKGHRVIEIGALAIVAGTIVSEFQTLIQTKHPISMKAAKVHGITDDMVIDQPGPEVVYPAFLQFLGGGILIAHNMRFDLSFLRHEMGRLGMGINNRTVCTLEMSRRRFPRLPNHKLDTVYRHLIGVNEGMLQSGDVTRKPAGIGTCPRKLQTHRALDDARMVAAIWLAMEGNR